MEFIRYKSVYYNTSEILHISTFSHSDPSPEYKPEGVVIRLRTKQILLDCSNPEKLLNNIIHSLSWVDPSRSGYFNTLDIEDCISNAEVKPVSDPTTAVPLRVHFQYEGE